MHDFVNALITAAAVLFGVGLGGVITLFNQRRQRADERLQQQLSEFYAPLLGLRMRILAKSETRVKSSGVLQTAWSEVLAGPRAIGDPELLKKTADEKWLAFQEAHDYSNRELREEIVPLYRKMVDIFTEKMWLAEPSTLIHFGVLVEYVEIWNRALAGAIPNDAMILYNHDEDKVKPLYADLASHVQRLSGGLQRTKTTRALDLKRGLNRLYLVFAVIWILGGFLYAYRTEKAA